MSCLIRHPRIVLIGDPGAGKSVTLSEIARRIAKAGTSLPILVSLRGYRGDLGHLIRHDAPVLNVAMQPLNACTYWTEWTRFLQNT